MTAFIGRREFITLLGGAAAAWPLAARAQQAERVRRIGVLSLCSVHDPRSENRLALPQGFSNLAGPSATTCRSIPRSAGNIDDFRKYAAELVALAPDVILATGTAAVTPCGKQPAPCRSCSPSHRSRRRRLCRQPGAARRQRHRLYLFEYGIGGKWLDLLKEIAPSVDASAVLRDPAIPPGSASWAQSNPRRLRLGVELRPIDVRDAGEIERAVAAFARDPNGGLIVTEPVACFIAT